jgi:hypothetical protein
VGDGCSVVFVALVLYEALKEVSGFIRSHRAGAMLIDNMRWQTAAVFYLRFGRT